MRTLESLHKQEDKLRALATKQATEGFWARRDITMQKLRAVLDQAWEVRNAAKNKVVPKPMTPRAKLKAIRQIIQDVDQRCMAADGPVAFTKDEITTDELKKIYKLTE